MVDVRTGLLENVPFIPSPHKSSRPCDVDLLVIHNISLPPGDFGNDCIQKLFSGTLNCSTHPYFARLEGLMVSAHVLIERTGRVIQFVPFHEVAWHAGVSIFENREACNDFSIGIELEGTDEQPFEPIQYDRLVEISRHLMKVYPKITQNRIVGHSDVAPGRKTDPGPCFDWEYYRDQLSR